MYHVLNETKELLDINRNLFFSFLRRQYAAHSLLLKPSDIFLTESEQGEGLCFCSSSADEHWKTSL